MTKRVKERKVEDCGHCNKGRYTCIGTSPLRDRPEFKCGNCGHTFTYGYDAGPYAFLVPESVWQVIRDRENILHADDLEVNGHEVIGHWFKAHDGYLYYCDSHDNRIGYWMTRFDCPQDNKNDQHSQYRRNVSERAIGRTFHRRHEYDEMRWPFKGDQKKALPQGEGTPLY